MNYRLMYGAKGKTAAVVALLLSAACESSLDPAGPAPMTSATTDGNVIGSLPQLAHHPQRIGMEALLGGTLVVEHGCFRLRSGSGESRLIVWAPHVTLHAGGRSVRSARSGQTARAGDNINFSGGEASAETIGQHRLSRPIPPECRGPYVIMGEGFTVA